LAQAAHELIDVVRVEEPSYREAIVTLRHQMLREGFPRETAIFSGDDDVDTRHFAAVLINAEGHPSQSVVCCASFYQVPLDDEPAWQLRGMATPLEHKRRGFGRELLVKAEISLTVNPKEPRLFWCNARLSAISFYESCGWICISGTFDIADVGPHRKMMKRLR
jgi:hypothetical protein